MVVGILIYSLYCPNCEFFKNGAVEQYRDNGTIGFQGLDRGVDSAYSVIREVCEAVGIPIIEVEISRIMGLHGDEAQTLYIPELEVGRGFRRSFIPRSVIREWIVEWIGKANIELPAFLIKSRIAKDRYINLEVTLSDPLLSIEWVAAHQVLRELARATIEEHLRLAGVYSYEYQELLLNRLFPVDEVGKPDTLRWIRSFVSLRHLKIRR